MSQASTVPVVIGGAAGRMGQTLISLAARTDGIEVVGAIEAPGHDAIGADAGRTAGIGDLGVPVRDDPAAALRDDAILIEFTWPEPSMDHLRAAVGRAAGAVLGTTGFSAEQQSEIEDVSGRLPVVQGSNMSVGITLLTRVVEDVARSLGPTFDIEVSETHHRLKKDAPSGTALTLARAAADGRDARLEDWAVYGRQGMVGERKDDEIGIMTLRGGDVVGDHTVFFYGTGERVEISHRAQSRDAFASGALRAAGWLHGRSPRLYSMQDVLFGDR